MRRLIVIVAAALLASSARANWPIENDASFVWQCGIDDSAPYGTQITCGTSTLSCAAPSWPSSAINLTVINPTVDRDIHVSVYDEVENADRRIYGPVLFRSNVPNGGGFSSTVPLGLPPGHTIKVGCASNATGATMRVALTSVAATWDTPEPYGLVDVYGADTASVRGTNLDGSPKATCVSGCDSNNPRGGRETIYTMTSSATRDISAVLMNAMLRTMDEGPLVWRSELDRGDIYGRNPAFESVTHMAGAQAGDRNFENTLSGPISLNLPAGTRIDWRIENNYELYGITTNATSIPLDGQLLAFVGGDRTWSGEDDPSSVWETHWVDVDQNPDGSGAHPTGQRINCQIPSPTPGSSTDQSTPAFESAATIWQFGSSGGDKAHTTLQTSGGNVLWPKWVMQNDGTVTAEGFGKDAHMRSAVVMLPYSLPSGITPYWSCDPTGSAAYWTRAMTSFTAKTWGTPEPATLLDVFGAGVHGDGTTVTSSATADTWGSWALLADDPAGDLAELMLVVTSDLQNFTANRLCAVQLGVKDGNGNTQPIEWQMPLAIESTYDTFAPYDFQLPIAVPALRDISVRMRCSVSSALSMDAHLYALRL